MSTSISNAFLNRKTNEFWLLFSNNECRVYVNVDEGALQRFASADDRDQYFETHIRKKYKFYNSIWDLCYPQRMAEKSLTREELETLQQHAKEKLKNFGKNAILT